MCLWWQRSYLQVVSVGVIASSAMMVEGLGSGGKDEMEGKKSQILMYEKPRWNWDLNWWHKWKIARMYIWPYHAMFLEQTGDISNLHNILSNTIYNASPAVKSNHLRYISNVKYLISVHICIHYTQKHSQLKVLNHFWLHLSCTRNKDIEILAWC